MVGRTASFVLDIITNWTLFICLTYLVLSSLLVVFKYLYVFSNDYYFKLALVMPFQLFKYSNMLVELGWFRTHLFLNYKKKLLQLYQSRTYGDSTELSTLLCLQKQLPPSIGVIGVFDIKINFTKTYLFVELVNDR
ncbi:Hypothetical_protein [Hexamita inflata]|uniref:Hypothetical_protein n=1 Tax=Hexamita inflata TaxID=28002 RepID=A0ABP1JV54_9EUKA